MKFGSSADTAIRLSMRTIFLCNKIKTIKPDCIRDKFVLAIYFYDAVCIYTFRTTQFRMLFPYIFSSFVRILLET